MKSGLLQFAEKNPYMETEPAAAPPPMRDYRKDERRAAELKAEISAKMRQAVAPQMILYDAFELIGILSRDEKWAEDLRAELAKIYEGLDEPALFTVGDAERLQEKQQAFKDRVLKNLKRNLSSCERLTKDLEIAIAAAEGLIEEEAEDAQEEHEEGKETVALDVPF